MKINELTDKSLLTQILTLVQEERRLLGDVLLHLREIDNRKLYADVRCSSLFDYCVKILKYSESQASRRVSATRLLKSIPEIMPSIINGDLNLTHLNRASTYFNDEKIRDKKLKQEFLNEIKGKSIKEVDKLLWELSGSKQPKRTNIKLKDETLDAIKKVQALKAHKFKDIDEVIMEMTQLALKEWDPSVVKRKTSVTESRSRYVPVQVQSAVWERDHGKCQNCESTWAIEIDHITPFALGGPTTVDNLRLLCRNCNQRKGIVDFPNSFKEQKRSWIES